MSLCLKVSVVGVTQTLRWGLRQCKLTDYGKTLCAMALDYRWYMKGFDDDE
jgi:predicted transcriptional regulator with HTH domain